MSSPTADPYLPVGQLEQEDALENGLTFGEDMNEPAGQHPSRPVDVPINILDCHLSDLELGWAPTTNINNGLQQTFEWMKNQLRPLK